MITKRATYADLLALPEDVRAEVLAGEIVSSPAPLPRHSQVQGAVRRFLGGPFNDDDGRGGPGGWWIFVEVDVGSASTTSFAPICRAGAATDSYAQE